MRISAETLAKVNRTSIPLGHGGGYFGELTVFHELHCLVSCINETRNFYLNNVQDASDMDRNTFITRFVQKPTRIIMEKQRKLIYHNTSVRDGFCWHLLFLVAKYHQTIALKFFAKASCVVETLH